MKNFLSFLLVLIFSVGSFGVVFAATFVPGGDSYGTNSEGDAPATPAAEPEATVESCGKQEMALFNGKCTSCKEANESTPVYNSKSGTCVSRKDNCEAATGFKWDDKCSDGNETDVACCLGTKEYCNKKEEGYDEANDACKKCNLPEKYDDTIKDCHNPNLTPSTLLPDTEYKETVCEQLFLLEAGSPDVLKNIVIKGKEGTVKDFKPGAGVSTNVSPLDILGCAIKTGRVGLWMIPFYIKYFIQFALSLAGLVAVGSIVIGGYFYLFGALADDKDKGKRAIMYGILGFIVAILSWAIVNIAISILTR
jgi:hypothetical protein